MSKNYKDANRCGRWSIPGLCGPGGGPVVCVMLLARMLARMLADMLANLRARMSADMLSQRLSQILLKIPSQRLSLRLSGLRAARLALFRLSRPVVLPGLFPVLRPVLRPVMFPVMFPLKFPLIFPVLFLAVLLPSTCLATLPEADSATVDGKAVDVAVAAVAARLAEEGADAATMRVPSSSMSATQGRSASDSGPRVGPRFLVAGISTAGIVFTEPGSGTDPASGDDTDGVARRLAAMLSWQPLVDRLVADGFDRGSLNDLFYRMGHAYSPHAMGHKMRALFRRKFYPPPPLPPGEPAPAPAVYEWVLEEATLQRAQDFMQEHDALLRGAEARFGVPKEVAVGLLLVETRLGTYLGKEMALRNLASLAATDSLVLLAPEMEGLTITPDRSQWLEVRMGQKSRWAYAELKALLSHAADNEVDPVSMPGSVYGAIGICQFMPSNIPHYGVDGDGDGRVDLFNLHDAVHSLTHFLNRHGWKKGMDRAGQRNVLKRYNNSNIYANSILAVADALSRKAATP